MSRPQGEYCKNCFWHCRNKACELSGERRGKDAPCNVIDGFLAKQKMYKAKTFEFISRGKFYN